MTWMCAVVGSVEPPQHVTAASAALPAAKVLLEPFTEEASTHEQASAEWLLTAQPHAREQVQHSTQVGGLSSYFSCF